MDTSDRSLNFFRLNIEDKLLLYGDKFGKKCCIHWIEFLFEKNYLFGTCIYFQFCTSTRYYFKRNWAFIIMLMFHHYICKIVRCCCYLFVHNYISGLLIGKKFYVSNCNDYEIIDLALLKLHKYQKILSYYTFNFPSKETKQLFFFVWNCIFINIAIMFLFYILSQLTLYSCHLTNLL